MQPRVSSIIILEGLSTENNAMSFIGPENFKLCSIGPKLVIVTSAIFLTYDMSYGSYLLCSLITDLQFSEFSN